MPIAVENQTDSLKTPLVEGSHCHHCGEDVGDIDIFIDEKAFCCDGCKMVFEILNTNDLSQYYDIEPSPGISFYGQTKKRYAWLDDEETVNKLLDFQNDKIAKITFLLPQIHCASCIWLLENLYKLNEGVLNSQVNFLKKEAYVTYDKKSLQLRKLVELLALIGYAPTINMDSLDESNKVKAVDRTLKYQIGVAGFAFGNIMLLSFPEYLGLTDMVFQKWFGYLNLLLALPVVFFSGQSYLKSAFKGVQQKNLNIDVPISLGILTLFSRSAFEIISMTGAGFLDSLAGLVFFLLVGKWFQQKTYYHLSFERDYKSYFPIAATVRQNGIETSVPLNKLNLGDTVLVRHKELVPSDGILLKGSARIDYSFVTGESEPVPIKKGEKIYAGGRQMEEAIELTLIKKVKQSYLTQLWNESAFQEKKDSQISSLANRVGKWFTIFILSIAFMTLFYWLPINAGLAINAFTAVLIIACPCAVALSIPFTFGNVIHLFAKKKYYLKNTQVIENMAKVTAVVFDKTGTITKAMKNEIYYDGISLEKSEKIAIKTLSNQSNHPVSRQIYSFIENLPISQVEDFKEIIGSGIEGNIDGHFVEIKKHKKNTGIFMNGQYIGSFFIKKAYRTGLNKLISNWKNEFKLFLLSGDNDKERTKLEKLFSPPNLYFSQSPKNKLQFIKKLQENGEKVLMIGDGLNDAGALQQSDLGIVISENTNNFTPACDAILDAKQFSSLPQFFAFANQSLRLVYVAYLIAFIYNIIGLSFAVQGLLSPVIAAILMPLSSITIVIFGVGMSTLLFQKRISKISE